MRRPPGASPWKQTTGFPAAEDTSSRGFSPWRRPASSQDFQPGDCPWRLVCNWLIHTQNWSQPRRIPGLACRPGTIEVGKRAMIVAPPKRGFPLPYLAPCRQGYRKCAMKHDSPPPTWGRVGGGDFSARAPFAIAVLPEARGGDVETACAEARIGRR